MDQPVLQRRASFRVMGRDYWLCGIGKHSLMQLFLFLVLGLYVIVILFADLIMYNYDKGAELEVPWLNPEYKTWSNFQKQRPELLGLSLEQCDHCRRLIVAAILGAAIGIERRSIERPAGIRTMCLVAIGSAAFTLSSTFAFRDGPMSWDASRISAAIPSGVGFLGAGVIWKGVGGDGGHHTGHEVRGLTTASCVWLVAAVGVAVGGALYTVAAFTTVLSIAILRYAPRHPFPLHHDGPEPGHPTNATDQHDSQDVMTTAYPPASVSFNPEGAKQGRAVGAERGGRFSPVLSEREGLTSPLLPSVAGSKEAR